MTCRPPRRSPRARAACRRPRWRARSVRASCSASIRSSPRRRRARSRQSYDLGPGRGERPTRASTRAAACSRSARARTTRCRAPARAQRARGGAERRLRAARRVAQQRRAVARRPRGRCGSICARSPPSGVRYLPLKLTAGKHELKVKVSSRHPNPALSLAVVPASAAEVEAHARCPSRTSALERYLAAKLSLARGNRRDRARALARLRPERADRPLARARGGHRARRSAAPARARRDLSRELLRRAVSSNADAWYPPVGLANLEAAEGRTKEAIDAPAHRGRALARRHRHPHEPDRAPARARLRGRSRSRVRELARAHAARLRGGALCARHRARARAHRRGREVHGRSAAPATPPRTARFALLKAQRKYEQAAQELVRLRELSDVLDPSPALESELEHARIAGDEAASARCARSAASCGQTAPTRCSITPISCWRRASARTRSTSSSSASTKYPNDLYELRRVARGARRRASCSRASARTATEVIAAFEASGRKLRRAPGAGARLHGGAPLRGRLEQRPHAQHHARAEPGSRRRERRVLGARGRAPAHAAHGQGRRHASSSPTSSPASPRSRCRTWRSATTSSSR